MQCKVQEIRYLSADGEHEIYAKIYLPQTMPKGIFQICHGMNGYIGKYDQFADKLVQEGYVVCGNTHLGHKESVHSAEELGFFGEFNGAKYLIKDVYHLTKIIKEKYPYLPVFMFGHSMGSFIARIVVAQHCSQYKGAIFSATAGPQLLDDSGITFLNAIIAKRGYHFRSKKIYHILFKTANRHIENPRNDYAWVSKKSEEFVSDLTKTVFTVTGLRDVLVMIKECNSLEEIQKMSKDFPIFFFSGTEDPLGEFGEGVKRAVKLYEKAGLKDVRLRLYEGLRHECLSDEKRDVVENDIFNWLEKRNSEG